MGFLTPFVKKKSKKGYCRSGSAGSSKIKGSDNPLVKVSLMTQIKSVKKTRTLSQNMLKLFTIILFGPVD